RDLSDLLFFHRRITGAEVHLVLFLDLLANETPNALSTTDAVIADDRLWMATLVGRKPLAVKQRWERSPGALHQNTASGHLGCCLQVIRPRTARQSPHKSNKCEKGHGSYQDIEELFTYEPPDSHVSLWALTPPATWLHIGLRPLQGMPLQLPRH